VSFRPNSDSSVTITVMSMMSTGTRGGSIRSCARYGPAESAGRGYDQLTCKSVLRRQLAPSVKDGLRRLLAVDNRRNRRMQHSYNTVIDRSN